MLVQFFIVAASLMLSPHSSSSPFRHCHFSAAWLAGQLSLRWLLSHSFVADCYAFGCRHFVFSFRRHYFHNGQPASDCTAASLRFGFRMFSHFFQVRTDIGFSRFIFADISLSALFIAAMLIRFSLRLPIERRTACHYCIEATLSLYLASHCFHFQLSLIFRYFDIAFRFSFSIIFVIASLAFRAIFISFLLCRHFLISFSFQ